MQNFSSVIKSGIVATSLIMTGCTDRTPDAIGVTIQDGPLKVVKILTAKKKVVCTSGLEQLQIQRGDPLEGSTISQSLKELVPRSNNISMTQESNSRDIIIKNGNTVLAVFRKGSGSRELVKFHGGYITNFCDPQPTDGIELR